MCPKELALSLINRREAIGVLGATGAAIAFQCTERRVGADSGSQPQEGRPTTANDVRSTTPSRYGAYMCLSAVAAEEARRTIANAAVPALVEELGFTNEFHSAGASPSATIAFLRRLDGTAGDIVDEELLRADAVVHVAASAEAPITAFISALPRMLGVAVKMRALRGVVRPTNYTGNAMHNFAYAHQVIQQPGVVTSNAFLLPMTKDARWWAKDWMERHTYFLPRYDDAGRMLNEGHALAAALGIACLMRRTYKSPTEPAPAGAYDFLNYFECADVDVATFHAVLAALRDVAKNREWQFVREGPLWHGKRVATWQDLFA